LGALGWCRCLAVSRSIFFLWRSENLASWVARVGAPTAQKPLSDSYTSKGRPETVALSLTWVSKKVQAPVFLSTVNLPPVRQFFPGIGLGLRGRTRRAAYSRASRTSLLTILLLRAKQPAWLWHSEHYTRLLRTFAKSMTGGHAWNGSLPWVGENIEPDKGFWVARSVIFRGGNSAIDRKKPWLPASENPKIKAANSRERTAVRA
jgi:hypothetical protein